ncbi:NAD-binding protein [Stieleria sp. JC731]|uniref:NAD-binding protein n=1 Tax=Pirellulaceae TaxID=2691357 RepID=UPI001E3636FD|nr:NAD-binding protein [Stieleria sp. JC731]
MENEQQNTDAFDDMATLDPPGTIAVIGAGPLGLEAALYGRYLGYKVTVFEAGNAANALAGRDDEPIPMSPDRCMSPLTRSAIYAQAGSLDPQTGPLTIGQWLGQVWLPLTQTDLLRGRIREGVKVQSIEQVELTDDETGEALPPDFRLHTDFEEVSGEDFEAIIVAVGGGDVQIDHRFELPQDYYFRVGGHAAQEDTELNFWTGLKEIVAIYASLGGRSDLDLYRPVRG